ncbi:MAG: oligosaccharide flippase family protein [Hyphomicrobiaceae bacterium]|nr:MAG: oligosaccharide flippase family protein [Hyphomicrobiaceae bacterium]
MLADASARVWNAILSFALLPIYLWFIGAESFGIISMFASVQAIIALFDCSLAPSLTRELSRARATNEDWRRMHDLTRTMEGVYWGLAVLAGTVFSLLAPLIAGRWLNPEKLSVAEVRSALLVGAIALAVQWPSTLYAGGLVGLVRQKTLAAVGMIGGTLRAAVSIFCLWAISPTVEAIFWVAVVLGLAQTLIMRRLFWLSMPHQEMRGTFQGQLLVDIWRFALGVSAITITSVVLLQADKLAMSRLLRLDEFGYYAIASALANGLFIITGSIFSVSFPKFSELAATNDPRKVAAFYHLACQGVSMAVLPLAAVVAFFPRELLLLWTRDAHIAQQGQLILTVFVVGNVFNCLMSVPYTVQLAFGWTRIAIMSNLTSLLLVFPLIMLLFPKYGSLSGAITWGIINLGLLIAQTTALHYQVLRSEAGKWYKLDAGLPLLTSVLTVAAVRLPIPALDHRGHIVLAILIAWVLASACALAVLSDVRTWLVRSILPTRTLA